MIAETKSKNKAIILNKQASVSLKNTVYLEEYYKEIRKEMEPILEYDIYAGGSSSNINENVIATTGIALFLVASICLLFRFRVANKQ